MALATVSAEKMRLARPSYYLVILLVVYFLNFVDRQIIGILLEPIRRELAIPDWQLGVIVGLGFALLYTTAGIPIGWLADRVDRVWLVTGALVIWSAMTMLCGAAQNAIQLFLARIGVGFGEAGSSPASHSIISSLYPPGKRGSALSIWSLGAPLGSAIGLAGGALIAEHFGWRAAFIAVGAPGLLLALIVRLTLRDPPRSRVQTLVGYRPILADILSVTRKRSFLFGTLGAGVAAIFGNVTIFWGPTYFIRRFDADPVTVALYGSILIVGSTSAGTLYAGRLADRLSARWVSASALVPAIAMLCSAPLYWLALSASTATGAALLFIVPTALVAFWNGPIYALAQNLASPHTRALSMAILVFIVNIVGLVLGPTLTGALSSYFFTTQGLSQGLHSALMLIVLAAFPSALLFLLSARWIATDMAAQKDSDQ